MSLISGSNSLTPAIAGALDFRAVIVEKALLRKAVGCDLEVCSEYDEVFVWVFPLTQRENDLCCCSCRIAIRWTVLSKEDMSDALRCHSIAMGARENNKAIGVDMRLAKARGARSIGRETSPLSENGSTSALGFRCETRRKREPCPDFPLLQSFFIDSYLLDLDAE